MDDPNAEVQRKIVKNYETIQQLQNDFDKILFVDTPEEEEKYYLSNNVLQISREIQL